jgi:hypothetical protein
MLTLRLIEEDQIVEYLESAVRRREDAVELGLMVRRLRPVASVGELRACGGGSARGRASTRWAWRR